MLPTAFFHRPQAWMAWPIGATLGWATARWVRPRRYGPALAAGATVLAASYVSLMTAVATLAGSVDASITETIRTAGSAMLLALVWLAMTPAQEFWLVSGVLIGASIAWRLTRR